MLGHDNHRDFRIDFLDLSQYLGTGEIAKGDLGNDQVRMVRENMAERLLFV